MKERIIIQKGNKTILCVKFQVPKNSKIGQLDIIIDSPKKIPFEHAVTGQFFRHYQNQVHSISWHGYFIEFQKGKLFTPALHFKDANRTNNRIDVLWHLGAIHAGEPFAFPLFSLYVPTNMKTGNLNTSSYNVDAKIHYYINDVDGETDQRIDVFITPKHISAEQVLHSVLGFIYRTVDVETFNDPMGRLTMLQEEMGRTNVFNIKVIKLTNGHDIILRTVSNQHRQFTELEGTFSILIHDPNDMYNRLTNRLIMQVDEELQGVENAQVEILQRAFEQQVRRE